MIEVTRLNGSKYYINPHLIETIESSPDTTITLVTSKTVVVVEPLREMLSKIVSYRRAIGVSMGEAEAAQWVTMKNEGE